MEPGRGCTHSWGVVSPARIHWHKQWWEKFLGAVMEHPSVPGEGFQGNLLEQAQPVEGCIHSSPILHTGADGLCRDVARTAGAVWPLQAGGNSRSLRKGCSALPITPQGWKSPWPGPGSASHGDRSRSCPPCSATHVLGLRVLQPLCCWFSTSKKRHYVIIIM